MQFQRIKWYRMPCIFLISLLLFFCYNHARAEQTYMKLDEIVVTATRTEEAIEDIPVYVEVISEKEIREAAAPNVGDLIAGKVTGNVQKYSGVQQPGGLRGFHSDILGDDIKGRVLILIDGHRLGTGNMAKINTDFIERIEVIKGPSSALYGSSAFGGVINIITKKGKGKPKLTIRQDLGSFRYQKSFIGSEAGAAGPFSYAMLLSYEDIFNYDTKEYGEVFNTDERRWDLAGSLSFYPSSNHALRLGFMYDNIKAGFPTWLNYKTYSTYDPKLEDYSEKDHFISDMEYNADFFEGQFSWRGLLYYLWDRNAWYYGYPRVDDTADIHEDATIGTDQQFTIYSLPHNKLVVGATCEWLEKESEGRQGGAPSRPYTPSLRYKSIGIYTQDSINLLDDRLKIIAGIRYDRFALSTKKPETGTFESFVEREADFDNFTPRLGIVYRLHKALKARANISQGFRAPSADEMAAKYVYTSLGQNHRILGNPDLKPEKTTNYEVGMDFFHDVLEGGVSLFHTHFRDRIENATEQVEYEGELWETYENRGGADMNGIDISFTWGLDKTFGWRFGLEFSSSLTFNTKYEDSDTGQRLKYISDYDTRSSLRLRYKECILALTHVLVGPQRIENRDFYPIREEKKGGFNFLNLTFISPMYKEFELAVSIYNLLDKEYEWVRGYPMPERNFRVSLTYNF